MSLALVVAPWCWACAWPAGIRLLDLLLLPAGALGVLAAILRKERISVALLMAVACLLFQGWAMTLNSHSLVVPVTELVVPLEPWINGWSGSIERDLSTDAMNRVTALLVTMAAVQSLGRRRIWRQCFAFVMTATGVSIVLLGCEQRWSGAHDIFWSTSRHLDYFFATFRNVTNAGEFLNFATALAGASVLRALSQGRWQRTFAVSAFAVLIAGASLCGSRIAPLLAMTLAVVLLLLNWKEIQWGEISRPQLLVGAILLVAACGLMMQGAGWGVAQNRWSQMFISGGGATFSNRLRVDEACVPAVGNAGVLGFGPGTFPVLFPRYQARLDPPLDGQWLAAHNDYLQTDLEWGGWGACLWSVIFFGGAALLFSGWQSGAWRGEERIFAAGLMTSLLGVALMGGVDFPLQSAPVQLDVAVALGLAWSSLRWPRARGAASRNILRPLRLFLPSIPTVVDRSYVR